MRFPPRRLIPGNGASRSRPWVKLPAMRRQRDSSSPWGGRCPQKRGTNGASGWNFEHILLVGKSMANLLMFIIFLGFGVDVDSWENVDRFWSRMFEIYTRLLCIRPLALLGCCCMDHIQERSYIRAHGWCMSSGRFSWNPRIFRTYFFRSNWVFSAGYHGKTRKNTIRKFRPILVNCGGGGSHHHQLLGKTNQIHTRMPMHRYRRFSGPKIC